MLAQAAAAGRGRWRRTRTGRSKGSKRMTMTTREMKVEMGSTQISSFNEKSIEASETSSSSALFYTFHLLLSGPSIPIILVPSFFPRVFIARHSLAINAAPPPRSPSSLSSFFSFVTFPLLQPFSHVPAWCYIHPFILLLTTRQRAYITDGTYNVCLLYYVQ